MRRLCCIAVLSATALGPASAAPEDSGFLYGRVVTRDGAAHEGRLRWADEEATWSDLFNATKRRRPYLDRIPIEERRRGQPIKIFGLTVGTRYDRSSEGRSLAIRFGDLRAVRPRGSAATLVLRDGSELEVGAGSNDLGATIRVLGQATAPIDLEWARIREIAFSEVPQGFHSGERRLYGVVATRHGVFRGFIQWDLEECLATDVLDGEDRKGDDVALEMGRIRSIERDGSQGVLVILDDGQQLALGGTNDVDDGNRGIAVDDPRFGRVVVSWDAFRRLDFSRAEGSGPGYDAFAPGRPLRGRVTDADGKVHAGKIVHDLDESETWELLDGDAGGVSYKIPLGQVSAIVRGERGSRVVLAGGEELTLEGQADVAAGNDGVAVVGDDGGVDYVRWDRVTRIDLD